MVIKDAVKRLSDMLRDTAGDSAEFEAREIVREVTGGVSPFDEISGNDLEKCLDMAKRRLTGEPLQYIFGRWEFYGYDLDVGKGVLIPRPETEVLCEKAISHLKKTGGTKFTDLCAGSGCIGIAVAKQTGARGFAVEISDDAYPYLCRNIEKNGAGALLTPINGDILSMGIISRFENNSLDAILSNPPYVNEEEMRRLQTEVRFEPETALYGGRDGLDFYRVIFGAWLPKLKNGGLFAVETGDGQSAAVCGLMSAAGLCPSVLKDYAGLERVVFAIK